VAFALVFLLFSSLGLVVGERFLAKRLLAGVRLHKKEAAREQRQRYD
jgi:hypothetical protein